MSNKAKIRLEIGERIKYYRLKRGMTLEELARKSGYASVSSKSTIQKIEAGKSGVPTERLKSIAQALDVPPLVLLGIEPDDNIDKDDDVDKISYRLDALSPPVRDKAVIDINKILDYYETMEK